MFDLFEGSHKTRHDFESTRFTTSSSIFDFLDRQSLGIYVAIHLLRCKPRAITPSSSLISKHLHRNMNYTEVPKHASGLSHHTIATITTGAANTVIAAAQLLLGYLAYRAARSKMPQYAALHIYQSVS